MEASNVPMQVIRGALVVSPGADLDDEAHAALRTQLLARVQAERLRALVFDCGQIDLIDGRSFGALRKTADMARIMGVRSWIASVQPAAAAFLADLDEPCGVLAVAADLDDALRLAGLGAPR